MKIKLFAVFVLLLFSVGGALGAPINDYADSLEQNINISEHVEQCTCYDYSIDIVNDYNIKLFNISSVEI